MKAGQQKMKVQLLSIMYSATIKQIYKISKNSTELNQRLQKIGRQIGLRIADQFNDRSASRLNPAQNVKLFIKGILKNFMGLELTILQQNIQFLKKQHLYDIQYIIKSNDFADFVLLPQKMFDSVQQKQKFNYFAILSGFICGAVQTMNFKASIIVQKDPLQLNSQTKKNVEISSAASSKIQMIFRLKMVKQIKNDD